MDLLEVAQEPHGFIGGVSLLPGVEGLAKGAKVEIPDVASQSPEDCTPGSSLPSGGDFTVGVKEIQITKSRRTKFTWNGDEELSVGGLLDPIQRAQRQEAFRALRNEMEKDIAEEAVHQAIMAGNIVGTAGTSPFASDLKALTKAYKLLEDAGSPLTRLQCVMNTEAGMNLRNLTQLQKVSEGGNDDLLRRGVLGNLMGFDLRSSAGLIASTTAASGYLLSADGAIGAKTLSIDTGSGKITAGSIVTFGSGTKQYVVAEDVASGGTTLKLTTGLTVAVSDNDAVNIVSNTGTVAFDKGAIYLATRPPKVPRDGDGAKARAYLADPSTGIVYEIAAWGGAYESTYTVAAVWGVKTVKPENTVCILG